MRPRKLLRRVEWCRLYLRQLPLLSKGRRFCDASVLRHSGEHLWGPGTNVGRGGERRSPRAPRVEVTASHVKIKPCLTKPIAGDERPKTNPDEQPHNFIPTPINSAVGRVPRCAKFSGASINPRLEHRTAKRRSVICPPSEQWRCALRRSTQL